jgi:hypothetical protein
MNVEQIGTPIAIIKNEGKKTKQSPVISIDDSETARTNYNEIKLKSGEKFQQIPNPNTERQILYITGRSGSGKSYYTLHYCMEYKKMYPKRNIYLFSALESDSTLDKLKGLQRFKLSDEFCDDDIQAEDFKDSMVIFDDTDVISSKLIKNKVNQIMNQILQVGRHHNTSCIITTHTACNGGATKIILSEAHSITIFPNGLGGKSMKYLLDSYFGLDKKQIKKIKSLKSRWVTIFRTFPMAILSENEVYVINNNDDD